MIGFLVFLAGFRHITRQARPDHEWVSSLVFGAGLLVIALELVGDGLQAAAALDTVLRPECLLSTKMSFRDLGKSSLG